MLPDYLKRADLRHTLGAAALVVRVEAAIDPNRTEGYFWSAAKATVKVFQANREKGGG